MTDERDASTTVTGDFWRFWAAGALSNLGDGLRLSALPLLAAATTRDAFAVGAVTAVSLLPWATVGVVGGAVADRVDRRQLMIVGQLVRGLAVLMFALVAQFASVNLAMIYAVALIIGLGEVAVDSASQAAIPHLASPNQLESANSKMIAAEVLTNEVIGAPLGALLFGVAIALPFGVDAATFFLGAALVATVSTPLQHPRTQPPGPLCQDIADGLRYLFGHRLLRGVAIAGGLLNAAITAGTGILVLLVLEELGGTNTQYGIMLGVSALGGTAGALGASRLVSRFGRRGVLVGATGSAAVCIGALGVSPNVTTAAALLSAAVFSVAIFNVAGRTLRQTATPDHLLGRVVASFRLIGMAGAPIGAALGGLVASLTTLRLSYLLSGLFGAAATVLIHRVTAPEP